MALIAVIINIFAVVIYMFSLRIIITKSKAIGELIENLDPGIYISLSMTDSDIEQDDNTLIKDFTEKWGKKLRRLHRLALITIYITMFLSLGGVVFYNHNYAIPSIIFSIGNILLVSFLLRQILTMPRKFILERNALYQEY